MFQPPISYRYTSSEQPTWIMGIVKLSYARLVWRQWKLWLDILPNCEWRVSRRHNQDTAPNNQTVHAQTHQSGSCKGTPPQKRVVIVRRHERHAERLVQIDFNKKHRALVGRKDSTAEHSDATPESLQPPLLVWRSRETTLNWWRTHRLQLWKTQSVRFTAQETVRREPPGTRLLPDDPHDGHPGRLVPFARVQIVPHWWINQHLHEGNTNRKL